METKDTLWSENDACALVRRQGLGSEKKFTDILVDVGTGDNFYKNGQLRPEVRRVVWQ